MTCLFIIYTISKKSSSNNQKNNENVYQEWKVKSKVTKRTIADYTKPVKKVPYKTTLDGIRYAKLKFLKAKLRRIIKQEKYRFRWKKDIETLQRIKVYERLYWSLE